MTYHFNKNSKEGGKTVQFEKGQETETTQSNDLENDNTWLITVRKVNEWRKKE